MGAYDDKMVNLSDQECIIQKIEDDIIYLTPTLAKLGDVTFLAAAVFSPKGCGSSSGRCPIRHFSRIRLVTSSLVATSLPSPLHVGKSLCSAGGIQQKSRLVPTFQGKFRAFIEILGIVERS